VRTVARLNVAPVKGLALAHPERVDLSERGVAGDRRFYLVDDGGRLITTEESHALVRVRADYEEDAERLTLHFPGGSSIGGNAAALADPIVTKMYGREVPGRLLTGPWDQPLSRIAGRPIRLARVARDGDGNDAYPASLVSTASVEELSRRAGRTVDARRFRMLIEVAGCDAPHEEDGWIGGRVRVGGSVLAVAEQDARCVVTTVNPETGVSDLPTLKLIAGYRGVRGGEGIDFGVYATVARPGPIRVGDPVEPLG
jgi:hypothetical protein